MSMRSEIAEGLAIGRNLFRQGIKEEQLATFLVKDGITSARINSGWNSAKTDKEAAARHAMQLAMRKSEPTNMQDVMDMLHAGKEMEDECPWFFNVYAWRQDSGHPGDKDWADYRLSVETHKGEKCFYVNNGGWSFYLDDDLNAIMYYGNQLIGDTREWTFEIEYLDKEEQRRLWKEKNPIDIDFDDDVPF